MKFEELSSIYDKAYGHFDSLAKQRLTSHNFYFILVGASLVAFLKMVTDLREADDWRRLWAAFATFNIVIPSVFCGLDFRFKGLMETLKTSLVWVESQKEWPFNHRVFSVDRKVGWRRHISLTNGMYFIFAFHAIAGLSLFLFPLSPKREPEESKETTPVQEQVELQLERKVSIHFHLHLNKPSSE